MFVVSYVVEYPIHVDLERYLRRIKLGRPLNLHKYGNDHSLVSRDQIQVTAYVNGSAQAAYLKRQVSKDTFVVVDAATQTHTATCEFMNTASPIAGQMSCLAAIHGGGTFYVSRVTNRYTWDFSTPAVKYFWGFVDKAPDAPLDYPKLGFTVLPSALRAANTNTAP